MTFINPFDQVTRDVWGVAKVKLSQLVFVAIGRKYNILRRVLKERQHN